MPEDTLVAHTGPRRRGPQAPTFSSYSSHIFQSFSHMQSLVREYYSCFTGNFKKVIVQLILNSFAATLTNLKASPHMMPW